jgi:hypothetical protein
MYEHHSEELLPVPQFAARVARHVLVALSLIVVSLLAGMAGYRWIAGMSWIDSFLNTSMLLGGMGPVGDLPNDASKVFAGVYALYAGLILIFCAGIILAPIGHRILHSLHLDNGEEKDASN